jgi:hypothetical protein
MFIIVCHWLVFKEQIAKSKKSLNILLSQISGELNTIALIVFVQYLTKKVITRANVIAAPACERANPKVGSQMLVAAEESKIVDFM